MKVDLEKLKQYENDRWISVQPHPTAPLVIANYTQNTQFANQWDEMTMMCRGLILDLEGNIVQRPLQKFFNLNQRPETMIEALPAEEPHVTVKMDGSLGILYQSEAGLSIATRGSFVSDQALWATEWIRKQQFRGEFNPEYTYCFEIIFPGNRIVINYGDRAECVLLAVINVEDGHEISHVGEAMRLGLKFADPIYADSIEELVRKCETLPGNEEGYVARYPSGLRVKMKGAEYVRLHRIVTQCSARRVWECLSSGTPLETWLERVPDELFNWAKDVQTRLEAEFRELYIRAHRAHRVVMNLPTRKEQALYLQEHHDDVMGLVFPLLDGKSIDEAIWKRIRPEHEVPFLKEAEVE
jgi:RNA ligase